MPGKLRIAQFASSDMALRFLLLDQIQALQAMGHDVVAVCSPGPWVSELRGHGLSVETVNVRREPNLLADVKSLAGLYHFFKNNHFDVVHTHTPKAGLLGPIAARLAGVPVVLHTIHGLLFHDRQSLARQSAYWIPERITAAFVHRLLSQSQEDVRRAIATHLCSPEKITWIGNGIDVQRFVRCSRDISDARQEFGFRQTDFVVGSVGRLVKEKGLCELFEAVRHLAPRHPNLKLLVVGLPERDHSRAIPSATVDAMLRTGTMVLAEARLDMPRCYAAMNVLVHPSLREGVPRACLEASAMELPVIASDIRGCREVVLPEKTGLLVPSRDSCALANAIERLMESPSLCRSMGTMGREHVLAHYDHRLVLRRVLEVYREIEREVHGDALSASAG